MTGPEESHSSTRPISVAELLAKNGTIGAPPVGGRRRRRRGNSDSVSVAELTGEIPIVTADTHRDVAEPSTDQLEEVRDDSTGRVPGNGTATYAGDAAEEIEDLEGTQDVYDVHDDYDVHDSPVDVHDVHDAPVDDQDAPADAAPLTDEEADYAAHLEERDAEPMFFEPPARRPQYGLGPKRYPGGVGAEEMSPDPLDVDDDDVSDSASADMTRPSMAAATAPDTDADELPSYLRSSGGTLFGGDSIDDDLSPRSRSSLDDLEFGETAHDDELESDDLSDEEESAMSPLVHGALVVGQCVLAVLFGAGLFIGFDQLWKWNNIVALVLSVLVILGLVVGVRVVRKTEDIGSTLIAVAVGALVTLGPLALLQSA
jgi:hypothetical protein